MSMNIRKISETSTKMTLGWDPVPGATAGYRGRQEGVPKWTSTQQTQMTFAKNAKVEIQALGVVDNGVYPPSEPSNSENYGRDLYGSAVYSY